MSKKHLDIADAIITQFNTLPQSYQKQIVQALTVKSGATAVPEAEWWITLDEAAEWLEKHKSQVWRYVATGKSFSGGKHYLISNGKSLRDFRLLKLSVITFLTVFMIDAISKSVRRGAFCKKAAEKVIKLLRGALE